MINPIRNVLINISRSRFKKRRIKVSEKEAKQHYDLHKSDWEPLCEKDRRRFSKEIYAFTVFKNLSKNFNIYKDYYVSNMTYFTEILPRLNPLNHKASGAEIIGLFNDKNSFEATFKGFAFPKTIIRKMKGYYKDAEYNNISRDEALSLLNQYDKVVFKNTINSYHGNGVFPTSKNDFEKQFDSMKGDFIVQELVKQHPFLSSFNPTSVNVIRIFTVHWKGHIYVLDARFRIGAPGSFCDHLGCNGVNPLEIKLSDDGSFLGKPFDEEGAKFVDDIFGVPAEGKIPNFDKMIDFVKNGHKLYPQFGILGWDMTVDENGNSLCIEINSASPAITASQCVSDPLFMTKTVNGRPLLDEILEEPIPFETMRII